MMTDEDRSAAERNEHRKVARAVVRELDPAQRDVLADYVSALILLRAADRPTQTKVLDSLDLTVDRPVLGVLTKGSGRLLSKYAWKDRSWPARIGLSAAAIAGILTAGQGAAFAVVGTAVGVPLWIVFGSGDALAGSLLDEINLARGEPLGTDHQIPREARSAGAAGDPSENPSGESAEPDLSIDVDEIVEELEDEFSGEAERKRFDEALGIDPEIFDTVKARMEEFKEEVRSGGNPSQLLQKWLLKRKQ